MIREWTQTINELLERYFSTMKSKEDALRIARTVVEGKTISYVQSATWLAEYVLQLERENAVAEHERATEKLDFNSSYGQPRLKVVKDEG